MKNNGVRHMLIFATVGLVGMSVVGTTIYRSWRRDYEEIKVLDDAAYAAMRDPAFVEHARLAGYRVGILSAHDNSGDYAVVQASCARSDSTGPLPCDSFPYNPAHRSAIVRLKP